MSRICDSLSLFLRNDLVLFCAQNATKGQKLRISKQCENVDP